MQLLGKQLLATEEVGRILEDNLVALVVTSAVGSLGLDILAPSTVIRDSHLASWATASYLAASWAAASCLVAASSAAATSSAAVTSIAATSSAAASSAVVTSAATEAFAVGQAVLKLKLQLVGHLSDATRI